MKFTYSTITRTLHVFGAKMDHIFHNVNASEVEHLITDAKFKEATWRS
ncbi:hypothetical protein QR674_04795 [Acinetobacter chinensis]|uniref:Uncharacterized protein n=1 Tax=Acinetobacter chinensis TaxID=2004650 RepID=A0ABU3WD12_9GAMM|nr:hypothetical protein [Acinetobacter chinensis]MDV2468295.1 hypothetical protein [Acinetobacter chinensis]